MSEGRGGSADKNEPVKLMWPLDHYYSPVPNTRVLAEPHVKQRVWPPTPPPTPGIDWRDEAQVALCRDVFAQQQPLNFPSKATTGETEYTRGDQAFFALDAWVLQAFIRHLQPARVIEVGCGSSSVVTARVNREFFGGKIRFTCIDPYPAPFLSDGVAGISDVRAEEVQDTPLEMFDDLASGDVLFIDTTHTVKTGGDVPWIYNRILPRLKPGVVVHLHDAFLPGDYPQPWVLNGRAWNEIYLVQSFLVFNSGFEILFGVRWMVQNHWDALAEAFPGLTSDDSGLACSLWLRRV